MIPQPPDENLPGEDDDPTHVAKRLTRALNDNTNQLRRVQRRQRITAVLLGVLAWIVVAGGVLFLEVKQTQDENCKRDNTLRTGLLHVADFLDESVDRAEEAGTVNEEVIRRNRAFIESLRFDFALREC